MAQMQNALVTLIAGRFCLVTLLQLTSQVVDLTSTIGVQSSDQGNCLWP